MTFAELEENEQDLLKLTRWLRKIQYRDFFPSHASTLAQEHLAQCRQALATFTAAVYEQEGLPQPSTEEAAQIRRGEVEEGKEPETW
ncbi:hypothetical protein KSF_106070 [Reticulibacter mediterranei]|uniref:ChrB N-terminal domain-containing protein n=1 Tax=Reticulibacter mediterranei TaxID=2778369 RepID=A0A8J3IRB3_9CHLR|nr:hypothetical protein KSF_106070 [Reticulibacter mediterranei]